MAISNAALVTLTVASLESITECRLEEIILLYLNVSETQLVSKVPVLMTAAVTMKGDTNIGI